jgi:hypothetical protein
MATEKPVGAASAAINAASEKYSHDRVFLSGVTESRLKPLPQGCMQIAYVSIGRFLSNSVDFK